MNFPSSKLVSVQLHVRVWTEVSDFIICKSSSTCESEESNCGADCVPALLLKRFHEELAPVVHDIICASIVQSKYPTSYKHALVSPVPKVDNPTDINNDFRQIS